MITLCYAQTIDVNIGSTSCAPGYAVQNITNDGTVQCVPMNCTNCSFYSNSIVNNTYINQSGLNQSTADTRYLLLNGSNANTNVNISNNNFQANDIIAGYPIDSNHNGRITIGNGNSISAGQGGLIQFGTNNSARQYMSIGNYNLQNIVNTTTRDFNISSNTKQLAYFNATSGRTDLLQLKVTSNFSDIHNIFIGDITDLTNQEALWIYSNVTNSNERVGYVGIRNDGYLQSGIIFKENNSDNVGEYINFTTGNAGTSITRLSLTGTDLISYVNLTAPNICYSNGTNCTSTGAEYQFAANNFNGSGDFTTTGTVYANFFSGDGSSLTGINGLTIFEVAANVGNWSNDKTNYNTTVQLNTLYLNTTSNNTLSVNNSDYLDGQHGSGFALLSGANFTGNVNTTLNITANYLKGNGGLLSVNRSEYLGPKHYSSIAILNGGQFGWMRLRQNYSFNYGIELDEYQPFNLSGSYYGISLDRTLTNITQDAIGLKSRLVVTKIGNQSGKWVYGQSNEIYDQSNLQTSSTFASYTDNALIGLWNFVSRQTGTLTSNNTDYISQYPLYNTINDFSIINNTASINYHRNYASYNFVYGKPTLTSGTLNITNAGMFINVEGSTAGISTNYGIYIESVFGADNNWGIYNLANGDNLISKTGYKNYFGNTTRNASIYYDGNNLVFNTTSDNNGTNTTNVAWFSGAISATNYTTRTEVYDKSKGEALNTIKDASQYLTTNKATGIQEIDHKAYGDCYRGVTITDYSKPENITKVSSYCWIYSNNITKCFKYDEQRGDWRKYIENKEDYNITVVLETLDYSTEIIYPHTKISDEVDTVCLGARYEQALYELKVKNQEKDMTIGNLTLQIQTITDEKQQKENCLKDSEDWKQYKECMIK